MKIDNIIADLDIVVKIVGEWDNVAKVSELERDLVLDKLRTVYEDIRFARQSAPAYDETTEVTLPIDLSEIIFDAPANENMPQEEQEHESAQFSKFDMPQEPTVEDVLSQEPEELIEPEAFEEMEEFEEPEAFEEPEEFVAVEEPVELVVQNDPEEQVQPEAEETKPQEIELFEIKPITVVAESRVEPYEEPYVESYVKRKHVENSELRHAEETSVNQNLFGEDPIPVKHKIDRRVILSLYGDDPQIEVVERREQEKTAEVMTVVVPEITTVDQPHTEVLGEVIGKGNQTVADTIFTVSDRVDVATKVVTEISTSLRKMIGINDKFLMIRDLFNGNAATYEQAISALEVFTDLDDALIYIHETYAWNPNSEGTKLIIELLTRKLS